MQCLNYVAHYKYKGVCCGVGPIKIRIKCPRSISAVYMQCIHLQQWNMYDDARIIFSLSLALLLVCILHISIVGRNGPRH